MRSRTGPSYPVPGTAAASLLSEAPGSQERRLVAGITGPGGTGKSTLLDRLADRYTGAGLPVAPHLAALPGRPGRAALLVDDAHLLAEEALRDLHSALARPELDLVVAYRLWPERSGLRRLAAALDHHHVPVVLGALTLHEIAASVTETWGDAPHAATVEEIRRVTGGQPWLVSRLLAAVPRSPGRAPIVPRELLDRLGYELQGVEPALHELLVALAVGFDLSDPMPPALEQVAGRVDELVTRARHDGLLLGDGGLAPLVRDALLQSTPAYRLRTLQRALVEAYAADGRKLEPLAEGLARAGLRDRRVARALEHSADHLLPTQPAVAAVLYREAQDAGADPRALAARRAQAEWAAGHADVAWRILEELLESKDPPDAVRAANTAAALWADRGMLARAAETYRWLGEAQLGSSAPLAAVAMIGAGQNPPALPAGQVAPSLSGAAAVLLEQGLRGSVAGAAGALADLVRASDMMTSSGHTEPLPEIPAVVAALVALSGGNLGAAESVIDAALAGRQGGAGARSRLLLMSAWVAMQADRPDRAREAMAEATTAERGIRQRDELLLRALEVGVARRTDDLTGLARAWQRVHETALHLPVDLFTLLPLGELVIAAARLRDSGRLETHLREGWALLNRLGDPPLWSVPLHWSCVQAAILAERPSDLAPHAAALVRAAEQSRPAAVLAAAGKAWVAVLAGRFEAASVESAARALATIGLRWDGSRLAGHAAARSEERRDMARLLACARELHPAVGLATGPVQTMGSQGGRPDTAGTAVLSPREREIARLVLDGKNYREIGEAIFISPRTVEHHVARIRQRIDARSRSELLTRLRLLLDTEDTPPTEAGGIP